MHQGSHGHCYFSIVHAATSQSFLESFMVFFQIENCHAVIQKMALKHHACHAEAKFQAESLPCQFSRLPRLPRLPRLAYFATIRITWTDTKSIHQKYDQENWQPIHAKRMQPMQNEWSESVANFRTCPGLQSCHHQMDLQSCHHQMDLQSCQHQIDLNGTTRIQRRCLESAIHPRGSQHMSALNLLLLSEPVLDCRNPLNKTLIPYIDRRTAWNGTLYFDSKMKA